MECVIRQEGEFTIVVLEGEVDLHYSPAARKSILDSLNKQCHVLVDMSAVKYIDSSGIASLVEGFQLARKNQLQFGLVGVSDAATQVLKLARLDKVFPIKNSVSDFMNS